MRLLMWRAYPDVRFHSRQAQWREFLRLLPGQPVRVVCDQDRDMVRAVDAAWPSTHIHHCEWHLKKNAYEALEKTSISSGPAWDVVEHAFESGQGWDDLKTEWDATPHNRRLRSFINRKDPMVAHQMRLRARPTTADPVSVGPLEERQQWLRKVLEGRAGRMTNQERLNRLLLLMRLHLNGQASELAYSQAIHEFLMENGGRPPQARRSIKDRKGHPSLRP